MALSKSMIEGLEAVERGDDLPGLEWMRLVRPLQRTGYIRWDTAEHRTRLTPTGKEALEAARSVDPEERS